jgi:hypothetical protein
MIRFRKRAGAQLPRLELAAEIAETLFQMGGAAHRDTVIDAMAALRRSRGQVVDEGFRLEAAEAFSAFCDDAQRAIEGGALFTLPFGPNSLRWAMLDATARYGIAAPVVSLPERGFAS